MSRIMAGSKPQRGSKPVVESWSRSRTYGFSRKDLVPGTVVENTDSGRTGVVLRRPGPWSVEVQITKSRGRRRIEVRRPAMWFLNHIWLPKK